MWCWYIFYKWSYVFYLSLDPTRPLCWDVMCIYGWELLAACHHPEQFGDQGVLIVKRKNSSSKTSYKYALTLKNWVDWITTRPEKNVANRKMVHLRKSAHKLKKKTYFSFMTTFYNFTIKMETSLAKEVQKPIL